MAVTRGLAVLVLVLGTCATQAKGGTELALQPHPWSIASNEFLISSPLHTRCLPRSGTVSVELETGDFQQFDTIKNPYVDSDSNTVGGLFVQINSKWGDPESEVLWLFGDDYDPTPTMFNESIRFRFTPSEEDKKDEHSKDQGDDCFVNFLGRGEVEVIHVAVQAMDCPTGCSIDASLVQTCSTGWQTLAFQLAPFFCGICVCSLICAGVFFRRRSRGYAPPA